MGVGSSLHNEPYQKRSVMDRSCRVSIQPSDDTDTTARHEEGYRRSGKRVKALRGLSHEVEECFVWFVHMLQTGSFLTCHVLWHICGLVNSQRYYICPGAVCVFFFSPLLQLKHQIMNSLFQQEAIRTECPFKFELITNNLHLHSREL